jgi:hypothetical protein
MEDFGIEEEDGSLGIDEKFEFLGFGSGNFEGEVNGSL